MTVSSGLRKVLGPKRTEATPTAEVMNANLTRAAVYTFLSRAFKLEVDRSFLEKVIAIEPTVKLLCESQGDEELKEASRLLHEFTQHVKELKGQGTNGLIVDLAAEYASLSDKWLHSSGFRNARSPDRNPEGHEPITVIAITRQAGNEQSKNARATHSYRNPPERSYLQSRLTTIQVAPSSST